MIQERKLNFSRQKDFKGDALIVEEIACHIGVAPRKIHFMDILYNAIEEDRDDSCISTMSTFIYGSQQERHSEAGRNKFNYKKYSSGPLAKARHSSTQKEAVGFAGIAIPTDQEIRRLAQNRVDDFARALAVHDYKKSSLTKPIVWTIIGHSRGGMIARFLANADPKHSTLENGYTVTISAPGSHNNKRRVTIRDAEGRHIITLPLEINVLAFSATGGPQKKRMKEIVETRPVYLLDFLAVRDIRGYGNLMKPYNQRRTVSPHSAVTFVHIPVSHPMTTKGDKKRKVHMEIEILITYLYLTYLGYRVNPDKLKIPIRAHDEKSGKILSIFEDVSLGSRGVFSSKNCAVENCIAALQEKLNILKKDKSYAFSPWKHINVHEQSDRRFLVLRSRRYASVLEENLALAKLETKSNENGLRTLFGGGVQRGIKQYREFTQLCLAKIKLNDPNLKDPKNANRFFLLKMAAILEDRVFVDRIFKNIDLIFNNQHHKDLSNPALKIKDSILKFLEKHDVSIKGERLKEILIGKLPELIGKLSLNPRKKRQFFREVQNNLESAGAKKLEKPAVVPVAEFILIAHKVMSGTHEAHRKEVEKAIIETLIGPGSGYSLEIQKTALMRLLPSLHDTKEKLRHLKVFIQCAIENKKFIPQKDREQYRKEVIEDLLALINELPEVMREKMKETALKEIFPSRTTRFFGERSRVLRNARRSCNIGISHCFGYR